jgi:DGQHR domain-containing protein
VNKNELRFTAVVAKQSSAHQVLSFAAHPTDILRFAEIDRIGRDEAGAVRGFQRPQIASHIHEIQDYLKQETAVLPNPIVIALTEGATVAPSKNGVAEVVFDLADGPPGLVVDGQQRLSAFAGIERDDFQVFVAVLICPDVTELRRQFVLINNTRPLPKSLIYELLPTVPGLPARLSARAFAATLTERLNHDPSSSLFGQIYQHTNPGGVIKDTAIQKMIMHSTADGALRELMHTPEGPEHCFELISEYFAAVQDTFPDAWHDHKPKTSRLVHSAGIIAMGYVMEVLFVRDEASHRAEFAAGLECLAGATAWTSGHWTFAEDDVRPWNAIQSVQREILLLAEHLIRLVKRRVHVAVEPPQFAPVA